MVRRSFLVCLCTLCALALGGLIAQSAAAATNGTTAFTCKKKGVPTGAGFSKAHCRTDDAVASGAAYEHLAIKEGTATETRWTSEGSAGGTAENSLQKITFVNEKGESFTFEATAALGAGTLVNEKGVGGAHLFTGSVTLEYTGITAVSGLLSTGCKVIGGKIQSKLLAATAQGMFLKLAPTSGETFASVEMEGCEDKTLNGTKLFRGSILLTLNGATVDSTKSQTMEQNTLKFEGLRTGIEGAITISGRDGTLGETTYTPLSFTTVETP